MITPRMGPAFVEELPVGKFHGVGPATTAKMNRLGIHTGRDLRAQTMAFLHMQFGKSGAYYYGISRGIDERPVRPDRVRKSIGAENTFPEDLIGYDAMARALQPTFDKLWAACERSGAYGRTVTLKVKYADFQQLTRSQSLPGPVTSRADLERVSLGLLAQLCPAPKPVRLLGVSLSTLSSKGHEPAPATQICLEL